MNINVHEIFTSIQGEGLYTGRMMHFVRLWGCGLDCSWCDTPAALSNRPGNHHREIDTEEVVQTITPNNISVPVCFTGGEPTFQPDALLECVSLLRDREQGRLITMESNGTHYMKELGDDEQFFLTCSPKFEQWRTNDQLRAHGQKDVLEWVEQMAWINSLRPLHRLQPRIQLKFVVENQTWFEAIVSWLDRNIALERREYVPLVFIAEYFKGREEFTKLVKHYSDADEYRKLAELGFREIRFQVQSHKVIHIR